MKVTKTEFTLIEMLVVIAIISILASMLMPTLRKAINTAEQVSCSNNLKNIGSCVSMYAADCNNFVPGRLLDPTSSTSKSWVLCLLPYAQDNAQLWICPSCEDRSTTEYNTFKAHSSPTDTSFSASMYWVQTIGINCDSFSEATNLSRIHNTSTLIYSADTTGRLASIYNPINPNGWRLFGSHCYPMNGGSIYPHHMEFINLHFLDGHTESITQATGFIWADNYAHPEYHKYWLINR